MDEVKSPTPVPVVSGPTVSQAESAAVAPSVPPPPDPPIVLSQVRGSGWAEVHPEPARSNARPMTPRPRLPTRFQEKS